MKKSQLRQIIKEEINNVLNELDHSKETQDLAERIVRDLDILKAKASTDFEVVKAIDAAIMMIKAHFMP